MKIDTEMDQGASASNSRGDRRQRAGERCPHRRDQEPQWDPTLCQMLFEAEDAVSILMIFPSNHNIDHLTGVMDLVRRQYNLNFRLICDSCDEPHDHDELLAPER